MRLIRLKPRRWPCHWSRVNRRTADGRVTSTLVWICEYPYRTMRTAPCVDCEGCPNWRGDALARPAAAEAISH